MSKHKKISTSSKRWQFLLAKAQVQLEYWPTEVREQLDSETGELSVHMYFPHHKPVCVDGKLNPELAPAVEIVWKLYGFQFPPVMDDETNTVGVGSALPLV